MKVLNKTCVSITIELNNNDIYYSSEPYNVYLNGEIALNNINTNVFTLYNLLPDTDYLIKVNDDNITVKTDNVSYIYNVYPFNSDNDTFELQKIIDNANSNSLIRIYKGLYNITSLVLKSNITIELKKGVYLKALTNEDLYEDLDEYYINKKNERCVLGTWEGKPHIIKKSIIFGLDCENVSIIGRGIIDGDAQYTNWWYGFREKYYARPHMVFLNHCDNISIVGVSFKNSPCWTIHPFYSSNINLFDFKIDNPKDSPNTDGIDIQSCNDVNVVGIHFSVGDDCVCLKSGKIEMVKEFYRPSKNILIRNCLMEYGHGAVVLGSEMSSGIYDVMVERCYFRKTDRGLRIKTRRGRGNKSIVNNVTFNNIRMEEVLTPLTINMFYNCDPGSDKDEYIYTKEKLEVDERTPYLGEFKFENIHATDCEYAIGYFYGLPEMPIEEVTIANSSFVFKNHCGYGKAIMMKGSETCHRKGIVANNVNTIILNNVMADGYDDELFELNNVNKIIKN